MWFFLLSQIWLFMAFILPATWKIYCVCVAIFYMLCALYARFTEYLTIVKTTFIEIKEEN